ncbi:MAG: hypothetical protein ABI612_06115 [Betaproteobacteria bacterium]
MHEAANDGLQVWEMDEDPVYIIALDELVERGIKMAGDIDIEIDPVVAVIGWYSNLPVECALNDRTPHLRGYLCRTKSGAEVCVGNICGRKRLGDDFGLMVSRMTARRELVHDRGVIEATIARAPEIRERIRELWDGECGGAWLAEEQARLERRCPRKILENILQRAAKNNTAVYEDKEFTEEEKENVMTMRTGMASSSGGQTGASFFRETIGYFDGLVAAKKSIKALLMDDLETTLAHLIEHGIGDMAALEYRRHARWWSAIDRKLDEAETLIREGQRFFTANNLSLLHRLPMDSKTRQQLNRYRSGVITLSSRAA